jgi:outer membrane protein OmpA-like peptidoglycan-associated protein/predicted ester cyclase
MTDHVVDELRAAVAAVDVARIQACLAPGAVVALPQLGQSWHTSQLPAALATLFSAFPDIAWHPGRRYEADGVLVEEGVWSATHRGVLGVLPATGRHIRVPARISYDLADSLLACVTVSTDLAAMNIGLGVVVTEAAAAASAAGYTGVDTPASTTVVRPPPPSNPSRPRRRLAVAAFGLLAVGVATGAVVAVNPPTGHRRAAGGVPATHTPAASRPAPTGSGNATAVGVPASSPQPGNAAMSDLPAASPETPPAVVHNSVNISTDVLFDTGQATLTPGARHIIDEVAALLMSHHVAGVVVVNGYTDNVGTAVFNQVLSQQRADAVAAALRAGAIGQPFTIVARGHGETDPVATNSTPAGRQRNRRVTIELPNTT